jgi:Ca-activated chloride channel family protein
MTLLYPWMLFFLLPLFLLYKDDSFSSQRYKKRQKKLLYLALVFIILALSRPVITKSLSQEKFDAQDFIIALDASYSMQADDIKPSRYAVAKKNIAILLKKLNRDRFSIFAFTTNTILISPPTTDTTISIQALNALQPKYILTKGTSLQSLFQTISKTSYDIKRLIIFSDGGQEHDLQKLIQLCKKNQIKPYIIAVGSTRGSTLKRRGKILKDENNRLVISRINPILRPLALSCGAEYYALHSDKDISDKIISDITKNKHSKETKVEVATYRELFFYPLFIATLLFFLAVTKFHQLYTLIALLFVTQPLQSSILFDFHNKKAAKSAEDFLKMTPSVASYYNAAVTYYKTKQYKKAIELFTQIESTNPKIKQRIYYNMGNCAVKLKKYDRAKIYYKKALAMGFDNDAYENLLQLYKLKLKEGVDISNMLPKNKVNKKTGAKKSQQKKKKSSKNSASNANQKASQKSAGSGSSRSKKEKKQNLQKNRSQNQAQYKIGYKAYELINKGYTNEKQPW